MKWAKRAVIIVVIAVVVAVVAVVLWMLFDYAGFKTFLRG